MTPDEALEKLSKRELEVVQAVVTGYTNREIAEQIGISQHTVKNYLFRMFKKFGVSSRTQLLWLLLRTAHQKVEMKQESRSREGPPSNSGAAAARFED